MMPKPSLIPILLLLWTTQLFADPLFDNEGPLSLTLVAPFSEAMADRDKSIAYPGELRAGDTVFAIDLSLRGNRRLNKAVCRYPPLRVDFKKEQIKDTVFDKQNDVKLVVQCNSGSRYADYLRAEYLIYKSLNLLTPLSYQARWVEVTFVDPEGKMKDRTEGAFFVERKSRLAKRNDLEAADVVSIRIRELNQDAAALLSLFQFVIANPDYSLVASPPGEECCHNAKLLAGPEPGFYTPVIYDFDSAGTVDADYAIPADGLGINKVTQRLFRGYCDHNERLAAARAKMIESEAAIIALFESDPVLGAGKKRQASRFLARGFDQLKDEKDFERNVINRCR